MGQKQTRSLTRKMKSNKNADSFPTNRSLAFEVLWLGYNLSNFEIENSIDWKGPGNFY